MITAVLVALSLQVDWTAYRPSDGWLLVGQTQDAMYFVRPGYPSNTAWRRTELQFRSVDGALSKIALVEVDCVNRTSRDLQVTGYSGPNENGKAIPLHGTAWRYVIPGTMGEFFLDSVCSGPTDS